MSNSNHLINKLAEQDMDGATDSFMSLIQDKITDSLEVRKVELASFIMSDEGIEEEVVQEGEGMDAQRRWVRQVAAVGKANPEGTKRSVHRSELKAAARKYFQSRQPHGAEFTDRGASAVRDARKTVKRMQGEEAIVEGGPTRKHFQQVADLIKEIPDEQKRKELAQHHAGIFKSQNPRFDHARFYKAAGVNEESLDEVLTKSDSASKWISDFVKSDNPKFEGKSKKERIRMALGAYYAKQRNESVDEALQSGGVTNAQLNRNVMANLRKATQTLNIKGVNPQIAAAAHRDFGKLASKNPKAPGYMLLRKLSPNKAAAVQSLSQAGVPLGGALESDPNQFNQALQRIKRFK